MWLCSGIDLYCNTCLHSSCNLWQHASTICCIITTTNKHMCGAMVQSTCTDHSLIHWTITLCVTTQMKLARMCQWLLHTMKIKHNIQLCMVACVFEHVGEQPMSVVVCVHCSPMLIYLAKLQLGLQCAKLNVFVMSDWLWYTCFEHVSRAI